MRGIRLLSCGGKDNYDISMIYGTLDFIHNMIGVSVLIHKGDTGADSVADRWARDRGIDRIWFTNNLDIIKNWKPDIWVYFPRKNGLYGQETRDTIKELKKDQITGFEMHDFDYINGSWQFGIINCLGKIRKL